jgi:hypothetical protein
MDLLLVASGVEQMRCHAVLRKEEAVRGRREDGVRRKRKREESGRDGFDDE